MNEIEDSLKIRIRYDQYFGRWIAWGGPSCGVCYGPFGQASLPEWYDSVRTMFGYSVMVPGAFIKELLDAKAAAA